MSDKTRAPENPWTTLASRTAFEDGWLVVQDRTVRNPAGREQPYGVVRFKQVGARILPIDNQGFTYLVGQWRYGADYYSWELPAGGVERGENLLDGARRELREEIGLSADHWLEVLDMVPSGSVTDERQVAFIAWGFEHAERDPDPQERLQIRRVPFRDALAMALTGEIRDAGTIAVLAATALKASRDELPAEIVRRVV